jgi:hypothetical protein
MHDGRPAVVARRREAGDVGDHAAADGDHDVVAMEPRLRERSAQRVHRGEGLVVLADTDLHGGGREARIDTDRDARLGHDHGSARR